MNVSSRAAATAVFAVLQFLACGVCEAVVLVQSEIHGPLHDPTKRAAEIRITISFSVDPWTADRHVIGSPLAPPVYVQAYHNPAYPAPPCIDGEFDPHHVIVRWDAPAPPGLNLELAGSTALVYFGDSTATLAPVGDQPAPAFFYYESDPDSRSMTLVWSNCDPVSGVCVPEPGPSSGMLIAAMAMLVRRRRPPAGKGRKFRFDSGPA